MKAQLGPMDPEQKSDTPLLDQIIAEGRIATTEERPLVEEQYLSTRQLMQPTSTSNCRWKPCTFILFGQQGETHEQYHERKGYY
jgi:hypothetical protein